MNCPNGHLSTANDYCSVCGVKMDAGTPENEASPAGTSPESPEPKTAAWRIEYRVFQGNVGAGEAANPAMSEGPRELLLEKKITLIGRTSQKRNLHPEIACDWDDAVSHRHAQIELDAAGNPILTDVGSTNGTMLNGKLIPQNTPVQLKDNDRITLGGKTALVIHGPQE